MISRSTAADSGPLKGPESGRAAPASVALHGPSIAARALNAKNAGCPYLREFLSLSSAYMMHHGPAISSAFLCELLHSGCAMGSWTASALPERLRK